jgi:hypothetical protein
MRLLSTSRIVVLAAALISVGTANATSQLGGSF